MAKKKGLAKVFAKVTNAAESAAYGFTVVGPMTNAKEERFDRLEARQKARLKR